MPSVLSSTVHFPKITTIYCLVLVLALMVQTRFCLAVTPAEQLAAVPERWALAATRGDIDALMSLYSPQAFIHVVFTQEELRGERAIRAYYEQYGRNPPRVTILGLQENSIIGEALGILSGFANVEFPGQPPMKTHFSIVCELDNAMWKVKIQTTVKVD